MSRFAIDPVAMRSEFPTEQSFLGSLIWAGVFVLLPSLLLAVFPIDSLQHAPFYQALWGNGISPFILWFFAASIVHLLKKRRLLRLERAATDVLSQQLIPAESASGHAQAAGLLASLNDNLASALPGTERNLLLSRCQRLLGESAAAMVSDEEAGLYDREYMHASFALPRFMVWAIPILGFIGTVWGISQGIAQFSVAMGGVDSAADISSTLKENLPLVTENLATAFNTTFVALLLSIPLMLLLTWTEKSEEQYLITLDERWQYHIKPALLALLPSEAKSGSANVQASEDASAGSVASEINLLSAQVAALHETMRDLYEGTVAADAVKRED